MSQVLGVFYLTSILFHRTCYSVYGDRHVLPPWIYLEKIKNLITYRQKPHSNGHAGLYIVVSPTTPLPVVFHLLIQYDVSCKLCIVLSWGKQPSCTLRQKRFRQNRTQFAARNSLDKKLKDQSGALHSPLFAILHHKSTEWKTCFLRFFSLVYWIPL